jgi:predicted transcriptional regulator
MLHGPSKQICVDLGPLEMEVMNALWSRGPCTVREMVGRMRRPLALTTVMTTLVRLHQKGLATRGRAARGQAFRYGPKVTRIDWQRECVMRKLAPLTGQQIFSCLTAALNGDCEALLEFAEIEIKRQHRQMARRANA